MKSIRVLIVDDLPHVREGLATMLELAGRRTDPKIEVLGAVQNGCEAVQQARTHHPDVILMDLEMPVLDGYEATRQIKTDQPAARVIVLSIHANPAEQQSARAAGADGFVVKGASYQDLVNAILGRDESNNLFEKGEKS